MANDFSSIKGQLDQVAASQEGRTSAGRNQASNASSLRTQIEALERGDYGPVLEAAADDIELDLFVPPEFPWMRRARGIAEYRQAIQQNFSSVEDQHPEISSVIADGDYIVVIGRERGRIRQGGIPYDVQFVQRFQFRDGRLIKLRIIGAHSE